MAIGLGAAGILAGGSVLGGLAGALGSKQSQSTQRQLLPQSELENRVTRELNTDLDQFRGLIGAGPGMQDMEASVSSQRGLAALLSQFSQGGFLPNEQQFATANQFASQAFAPRYQAMSQNFEDQRIGANRNAALMGRGANDPILQAKLAQEQTRQTAQLDAERGSFAAQFAQNLPLQQLGFAQQLAQVQSGLASQALANRQALLNMGSQLKQNEQNFRLGGSSSTTTYGQNPWANAILGGLVGAGAGLKTANMFGMFGGDGGNDNS